MLRSCVFLAVDEIGDRLGLGPAPTDRIAMALDRAVREDGRSLVPVAHGRPIELAHRDRRRVVGRDDAGLHRSHPTKNPTSAPEKAASMRTNRNGPPSTRSSNAPSYPSFQPRR